MVLQATNADWLALTVEEPLEPDLPICDPHHHLWDVRPSRVAPRYLLDEILADVQSGHNAGKADEVYAQWRAHMAELATCHNVVAKLGGINMEVNGFDWHTQPRPPTSQALVDATRHYYDYTLEHFGVERCMFESNFPVDKASCSYTVLWNAFKRLTAGASADEKAKLFHDTAARVYRLD